MLFLTCYLLVGLFMLLRPANVTELVASTAELRRGYWPQTPAWVIALALSLLFLAVWPLALRVTYTRK